MAVRHYRPTGGACVCVWCGACEYPFSCPTHMSAVTGGGPFGRPGPLELRWSLGKPPPSRPADRRATPNRGGSGAPRSRRIFGSKPRPDRDFSTRCTGTEYRAQPPPVSCARVPPPNRLPVAPPTRPAAFRLHTIKFGIVFFLSRFVSLPVPPPSFRTAGNRIFFTSLSLFFFLSFSPLNARRRDNVYGGCS